jgi:hypothetical protein
MEPLDSVALIRICQRRRKIPLRAMGRLQHPTVGTDGSSPQFQIGKFHRRKMASRHALIRVQNAGMKKNECFGIRRMLGTDRKEPTIV